MDRTKMTAPRIQKFHLKELLKAGHFIIGFLVPAQGSRRGETRAGAGVGDGGDEIPHRPQHCPFPTTSGSPFVCSP
jgi:hypothetical protein